VKNSLNSTVTSNAVLPLTRLVLPAILAGSIAIGCGPQAAQAQQPSLVGQWRTVAQGSTVNLTIQANGQYMLMMQPPNGGTQSAQGGPYQLVAPNTIVFTVTDWSPKTRWNFVPNPTCGVPGVTNPTNPRRDSCHQWQEWTEPRPPGGRDTYVFNGPNTVVMTDEHGSGAYTRVTGR